MDYLGNALLYHCSTAQTKLANQDVPTKICGKPKAYKVGKQAYTPGPVELGLEYCKLPTLCSSQIITALLQPKEDDSEQVSMLTIALKWQHLKAPHGRSFHPKSWQHITCKPCFASSSYQPKISSVSCCSHIAG